MNEQLWSPLKFYKESGQKLHHDNTEAYFDELTSRSGVNVEENRQTVKQYNDELTRLNQLNKQLRRAKTLKILCIVGIVLFAISAILVPIMLFGVSPIGCLIASILCILALVGCILALLKSIKPKIKELSELQDTQQEKTNALLALAWQQMAALNALFSQDDPLRLIEKTLPSFSFDRNFTSKREISLRELDFVDLNDENSSVIGTLSGSFSGNSFIFLNRLVTAMGKATYHGSLVISWTESYRDSNGNLRTRTRTQTLHASVVKPKPEYFTKNALLYTCQSGPELSFSREAHHWERMSEKEIEKKVSSGEKSLHKKASRATEDGGTFQEMSNSEFEILFDALDRDHEVQFRDLFTPLAQTNMVDILTDKEGYGDDFSFSKHRRCNIIASEHAQNRRLDLSPSNYTDYSFDAIKEKFITFNDGFFRSIYFDFLPLFSIPSYLEEPIKSLDFSQYELPNYSYYEHELMANTVGSAAFAHPRTDTDVILKASHVSSIGDEDTVEITAYSYATEPRVDFVPVRGGDGHVHPVPVPWTEYIPISNTSLMKVESEDRDTEETNRPTPAAIYRGLRAFLLQN